MCPSLSLQSDNIKYLGIVVDRELRFEEHILGVCGKLSAGCYAVRVAAQELGVELGRSVYFSLIESHLRYGICFWGNAAAYLIQMLFVLQKRAVRYICGAKPRDSCRPLFIKLGIHTVFSLYIQEVATVIFRNRFKFVT